MITHFCHSPFYYVFSFDFIENKMKVEAKTVTVTMH